MHATKRKFNALLQGLGTNPRPTSSDDATTTMAAASRPSLPTTGESLLQKRRRLGLEGAPPTAAGPATPKPSTSSIAARRWSPQVDKKQSDAPAKYSPTDRNELLRRLATFQELTDWTPKPERVSEIEWAKRGWVCQGKERVRCVLCHKEVVVKFNRKEGEGKEVAVLVPSEVGEALVDKYAEMIVTSHQEDCLWRKRGCEDALLRLSLANAKASLGSLRLRYDELCARKPFLPYDFNLRLPEDLKLDDIIPQLPPTFFTEPAPADTASPSTAINRVALSLALLGWQGLTNARIGAVPNSASCHTCLRRLGLWMFKSKEVDDDGNVLVPAPMDHLDPVREHRFFCPWKNAQAQSRSGQESDVPGWRALLQTIANEAHLRSVYAGRPKTKDGNRPKPGEGVAPTTPVKSVASVQGTPTVNTDDAVEPGAVEEDEKARDAKDKERWARLRRVKSLFDSKGARKMRRPLSRPGTSQSTRSIQEKE